MLMVVIWILLIKVGLLNFIEFWFLVVFFLLIFKVYYFVEMDFIIFLINIIDCLYDFIVRKIGYVINFRNRI